MKKKRIVRLLTEIVEFTTMLYKGTEGMNPIVRIYENVLKILEELD